MDALPPKRTGLVWGGNKQQLGTLKRLITEETLIVEKKGSDAYEEHNCIHLVMATNEDWHVPAGPDERRWFVLDVSDRRKQDRGGEAGLRLGEIAGVEWDDVDLAHRRLTVQRAVWRGHVTAPKSGRRRRVPMTQRLTDALRNHRHLRSARVLCDDAGVPLTPKVVAHLIRRCARRAGLSSRGVHVLRHSFCSHLAMRGAPPKAIQELAGHQELGTTQRYMHLSPAALDAARRLLDVPHGANIGDMLETASAAGCKSL